ncbi:hypothetical protein O0L34_g15665 [Tuta absoluta]|nr:hypothetical protein O0L34_g12867 [Tuta absoluta]KAJ2949733.1 hypothetical protein O0L34_g15665 [Tuta absoluta]
MHCFRALVILLLLNHRSNGESSSEDIKQEGARVIFVNPKYVKDVNFITRRKDRNSPYLTNGNATTLYPVGNNVTVVLTCFNARTKREIFTLDFKTCEIIKLSWAQEWLKQYSNVPSQCPVPPGTFLFNEIELPPKKFPLDIPVGDYGVLVSIVMTKTKEKIADVRVNLRITAKKRSG